MLPWYGPLGVLSMMDIDVDGITWALATETHKQNSVIRAAPVTFLAFIIIKINDYLHINRNKTRRSCFHPVVFLYYDTTYVTNLRNLNPAPAFRRTRQELDRARLLLPNIWSEIFVIGQSPIREMHSNEVLFLGLIAEKHIEDDLIIRLNEVTPFALIVMRMTRQLYLTRLNSQGIPNLQCRYFMLVLAIVMLIQNVVLSLHLTKTKPLH